MIFKVSLVISIKSSHDSAMARLVTLGGQHVTVWPILLKQEMTEMTEIPDFGANSFILWHM